MSQDDADKIILALINAFDNDYHVVVHCDAGVCRSGAVAEAGRVLGFEPINNYTPNIQNKKLLFNAIQRYYEGEL